MKDQDDPLGHPVTHVGRTPNMEQVHEAVMRLRAWWRPSPRPACRSCCDGECRVKARARAWLRRAAGWLRDRLEDPKEVQERARRQAAIMGLLEAQIRLNRLMFTEPKPAGLMVGRYPGPAAQVTVITREWEDPEHARLSCRRCPKDLCRVSRRGTCTVVVPCAVPPGEAADFRFSVFLGPNPARSCSEEAVAPEGAGQEGGAL